MFISKCYILLSVLSRAYVRHSLPLLLLISQSNSTHAWELRIECRVSFVTKIGTCCEWELIYAEQSTCCQKPSQFEATYNLFYNIRISRLWPFQGWAFSRDEHKIVAQLWKTTIWGRFCQKIVLWLWLWCSLSENCGRGWGCGG